MNTPRGTRPTKPYRWPRRMEDKRLETERLAAEIVRIVEILRADPFNEYLFQEITGDVRFYAERIRRLMAEAKLGPDQQDGNNGDS